MVSLKCLLGYHRPVRSEVSFELEGYVGKCERCEKSIKRLRKGRWVKRRFSHR